MPKRTWNLTLGLAALLAACAPAPTVVAPGPGSPGPGSSPAPGASASPSAGVASPEASASGQALPSASPASPQAPRKVSLSGSIYDLEGAPVDKARVVVRSLDQEVPFEQAVESQRGSYVVRGVPEGVALEVVASRNGWTSRRRTAVFDASGAVPVMDFGGPAGADDTEGAPYFLARHPEIASITPPADSVEQGRELQAVVLQLSEALDADNRKRFEDGLRLLPASAAASPGRGVGLARDLTREPDGRDWSPSSEWAYALARGSTFLGDSGTKAEVVWNEAGDQATLRWKAPLALGKDEAAKYQLALVAGPNRIVDAEGLQLGTDKDGNMNAYPAEGKLVHHAFRHPNLALGQASPTAAKRWAQTHALALGFSLVRDAKPPQLLGLSVARVGEDSRLELSFSEPMTVFDGTDRGFADGSVIGESILSHLHLAIAKREGSLDTLVLDGKVANTTAWDPQTQASWGSASEQERAFRFDPAAFSSKKPADETTVGKICVSFDALDPRKIVLTVIKRPQLFATEITHLRARVEGVADPAGNAIEKGQADREQPIFRI